MNQPSVQSITELAEQESLNNEEVARRAFVVENSIGPASSLIASQIYTENGGYVPSESLSPSQKAGLLASQAADLWLGSANAGTFDFPESKK